MGRPKHWALILATLAIATVVVERLLVMLEPEPSLAVASEPDAQRCAAAKRPALARLQDDSAPALAQPGGIDPLGVSSAIRGALEACP